MATPSVLLYYWSGTAWVKAVTHAGNSAVLLCTVTKSLNNPSVAELILSNRSKDPSSTDTALSTGSLSDATGEKATLFREFQDIRLIDNETGISFFRGRLYHIRNQYDFQYGNTVKLIAKDMLQELVDVPIDNAPPPLRSITLDSTTNSRSKLIGRIIGGLSTNFITTESNGTPTDSTKFEGSAYTFTADEMKTDNETETPGTYVWDIATGQQQALALINDFAKQDPHDSNTDTAHFGYDYYVDSNIVSSSLSSNANSGKVPLHYFKRGSRPHSTNIPDYGVTLEYPSAGWGGQTGFRKAMLSDAEFTNPNGAFFTSIVAHFEDKGTADDDTSNRKIHGIDNYELVRANIPATISGGGANDFPWQGLRIQYIDDGEVKDGDNSDADFRRINEGSSNTTNSASETIFPGQSMNTSNPRFLFESSQALPCATVHFQSGVGTNGTNNAEFLILSNVYKEDTTWTDPQGNEVRFKAFPANPTGSNVVRLHLAKSQSTSGTTYPYIIIGKDARAADKHDINKPHRIHIRDLDSYDTVRKSIAGILDRASRATVTIGKVRTSRYPYVQVRADTGSSLNSRSSNTITFGTNTFKDAAGDNAGNNPTDFGVKTGMVVAQMTGQNEGNNTAITRYAYISAVSSSSVTYGASQTDTSDGTALDPAYDLALLVPTETGHTVRLKNKLYGVDYDVLVQKIQFDFSPGVLTTQVEGVGVNNNTAGGVSIVPSEAINVSIVGGDEDKGYSFNLPPNGQAWEITDGTIKPYDANHLVIASNEDAKTITLRISGNGKSYQVDVADQTSVGGYAYNRLEIGATSGSGGGHADFVHSNIDDTGPYIVFFRTKGAAYKSRKLQAIAVQRKIQSGSTRYTTGGKIYSEIQSPNDIIIAVAQKDTTGGVCVLQINGGAFGSGWPIDISAMGNNRMTNSLLKKGAQPFATTIEFLPCQANGSASNATHSNAVYNAVRWTTGNISFAEDGANTMAISDGHLADLSASTTYYAYLTLGDGVVRLNTNYRVPFEDDKVLLATVVVGATPNPNVAGHSPSILPIAGKQLTLSAVNMTANTILADHISAGSITADKLESDLVISNTFKTAPGVNSGSGNESGIIIKGGTGSAAGISGYNSSGDRVFWLNPDTGTVTVGGGQDGAPGSRVFRTATEPTNANTDPDLAAGDIWIDITTYVNPLGQTRTKDLSYVWTGSAWEQVDHADAINNASTVVKGGLIATQKIILADGGGSWLDLDGASAPNSARIEMSNASIIGYSSGGTSSNEQFRIDADTGKAYFGAGAAELDRDGMTIASAGTPVPGTLLGGVATADINTISFGWGANLTAALATKYVSLGGYYGTNPNNMTTNAFSIVWWQSSSSYLTMHDFNRGSIGNLTGISSGGIYAADSSVSVTKAGNRQFWRPPANVHSGTSPSAVADNVEDDGISANLGGLLRIKKDGDSTGRGDKPWGTEWVLIDDIVGVNNAVTAPYDTTAIRKLVSGNNTYRIIDFAHNTAAGFKHVPTGGSSGNILTYSSSGTAVWAAPAVSGVTSIVAGTGISINAGTGAVTITNTGATSIVAGTGISVSGATGAVTITNTVSDTNTWRGIDDTPVNGQTAESISSNWAYDHTNNATAHQGAIHSHSSSLSYSFNEITMADKLVNSGDTDTYLTFDSYDRGTMIVGGYYGFQSDEYNTAIRMGIGGTYESGYALKVWGETKKTSAGGDWDESSDDRIKTDVASITGAVTKLKTLNPVSFKFIPEWREANPALKDITEHGFLASDFESTFPNKVKTGSTSLVKLADNTHVEMTIHPTDVKLGEPLPEGAEIIIENVKSLNGGELTPYLVAAIKELEARIVVLEGG